MATSQIPYQFCMLLSMMTRRLDDHNFITWSYQFQTLLEGQDLFGYIDGNTLCPTKYVITDDEGVINEITTDYKEWKKTDKAILSLLIATLSFDVMDYVVGSKTSREAWMRLNDIYATNTRSHVMQLKTDLYTITKGMDSVDKFLMKVIRVRNHLAALGERMEDEDIVVVILNGLPAEFNLIKAIIRARETPIAISELRILLLATESDIANRVVSQRSLNGKGNMSNAGICNMKGHAPLECNFLGTNIGVSPDVVDGGEQTVVIEGGEHNMMNIVCCDESDSSGSESNIDGNCSVVEDISWTGGYGTQYVDQVPYNIVSSEAVVKNSVCSVVDMIRKLAEEDPDESNDKDKKDVEKSDDDDEKKGQYTRFWNEFGKSIKLGIIVDAVNRNHLVKLLRFESTKSDGKLTSLDQYISRMKSGQKDIFYLTGTSKEQLDNSLFLERLKKKGYEVIFFTDPVDEYLMQYLMDYEDKKFQNTSKEGLKLGKDSKDKELKESFKELTKWWKGALASDNVDDVKLSNQLADTPCVVVTSKFGWSANMEKIMQSQTLSDSAKQEYMRSKRVLEINPRHPIIKELRERVVKNPEDESVKHTTHLIYQTALMESGFVLYQVMKFSAVFLVIFCSVHNFVQCDLCYFAVQFVRLTCVCLVLSSLMWGYLGQEAYPMENPSGADQALLPSISNAAMNGEIISRKQGMSHRNDRVLSCERNYATP